MKNNFTSISLSLLVLFFSVSCNPTENDIIKNKFIELIKLDQKSKISSNSSSKIEKFTSEEPQDSTELMTEDAEHLTTNFDGLEIGGDTRMTMYEYEGDIFVVVQNRTGNQLVGYKLWNDTYKLDFDNISTIGKIIAQNSEYQYFKSESTPVGIGGSISESKEGTKGISYEIKFYPKKSYLRIVFYGSGSRASYQVGDFYFEDPKKALSIMESIQSSVK
jgi:hypothetical protein